MSNSLTRIELLPNFISLKGYYPRVISDKKTEDISHIKPLQSLDKGVNALSLKFNF